jgi:ribosomal protein S21
VGTKVVVREGESVETALRRMRKHLQRECIDDRFRRRWWRVEYYQKPGYRRWQQKFFAKAVGRHKQQLLAILKPMGLA